MGLEWNQDQLKIALLLQQNKTCKQINDEGHYPYNTALKVRQAIEKGDLPPSLEAAYIAAQPPGKKWEKKAPKDKAPPQPPPTKVTKALAKVGKDGTLPASHVSYLQLVPQTQVVLQTPNIFISYICALKNGYKGDIGDWIDLACADFWLGRDVDHFKEVTGIDSSKEVKEIESPA